MKHLTICFYAVFILAIAAGSSLSQTRPSGTHTEKDSATGITRTTSVENVNGGAEVEPQIHNLLAINPLAFILVWNLAYYHAASSTIGLGIGLQIPSVSHLSGFGVNFETRIYTGDKALRRFYIAPNISYTKLTSDLSSVSVGAYSVGLLLGWQWFVGDAFAIGLGIGFNYYSFFGTVSDNTDFTSFHGTLPALRFDIGYGW